MEEIKVTIEVQGKKYEMVAENVLISVANTEGDKIATINNQFGNLGTIMRMYCSLGGFINQGITKAVYDKDIPLLEQVIDFAPSFEEIQSL